MAEKARPANRGRRGETAELWWPWKRGCKAVAVETNLSSRGREGEAVELWPWRPGCRAVAVEAMS